MAEDCDCDKSLWWWDVTTFQSRIVFVLQMIVFNLSYFKECEWKNGSETEHWSPPRHNLVEQIRDVLKNGWLLRPEHARGNIENVGTDIIRGDAAFV